MSEAGASTAAFRRPRILAIVDIIDIVDDVIDDDVDVINDI